ncbi:MAG: MFS transporter [Gemmatimonadales bacterium]
MTATSMTSVRWKVLGLLVLASAIAYLYRINVSIAGTAMAAEYGLSTAQLGMVLAAFAWSYGLLQIPGGIFGEFVGARRGLAWTIAGWGVVTAVLVLVPGPRLLPTAAIVTLLIVVRVLQGALQAPLYPLTSGSVVTRWFPRSSWGLPNGLSTTGLTLGSAIAGPFLAWLIGAFGWRLGLLVTAPAAVLLAAAWWWYFRDDPADHAGVSPAELALIKSEGDSTPSTGSGLRTVLLHRDVLSIAFSYFCLNYVYYLFFNWFFYYLTEVRKLPAQAGGTFVGAQWIVGAIAATLGGILCDRLVRRFGPRIGFGAIVGCSSLVSAPFLVAGALAESAGAAVVLLSLSFGFVQLSDAAYWTATMRVAGPHAPAATGVLNTGGNVVGGVGALLVPLLASSFGWVVAISTGAVFAVLAAVPWLWIRTDRSIIHQTK